MTYYAWTGPSVALFYLSSSSVHLTDDHRKNLRSFSKEIHSYEKIPDCRQDIDMMQSISTSNNVYSFGVLLFEIVISQIMPFSVDNACQWNGGSSSSILPIRSKGTNCSIVTSLCPSEFGEETEHEWSQWEITKTSPAEFAVPKLSPF